MNNQNTKVYTSLEPSYFNDIGIEKSPTFDTQQAVSLFTSTSFLYTLGIMIAVVAAGFMYIRAGLIRMKPSEQAVSESNAIIKRTTLGLLGVLSLFVIIYTFNPDLLTGNVSLSSLKSSPFKSGMGGSIVATDPVSSSGVGGATCADPKTVIASLSSKGGVCGAAQCTALSGCNYQKYLPQIQEKARQAGVNPNMVIALMCRESKGNPQAQHKNADNTFDCGLMQVNQNGACDASSLEPDSNISKGISELKKKMTSANQVYQNIPTLAGVAASYNCCSNGTIPNAPSADCTQEAGFPYSIPKWACPINPGTSVANMCFVKNYACDVNACVEALEGM